MAGKDLLKKKQRNKNPFFSRVMLMLYELDVLQSDCERIGDPVALPLTDIINNGGNTSRLGKILIHSFNNILFKLF